MIRMRSRCLALVLILLCQGCERTEHINSGGVDHLRIGMSKQDVLSALSRDGVRIVKPVEGRVFYINYTNVDKLNRLSSAPGICIHGDLGRDIQISIANGSPKLIYSSIPAKSLTEQVWPSSSLAELLRKIDRVIRGDSEIVAHNCIVGIDEIATSKAMDEASSISRFDHWFYYIPGSYSTAVLHFDQDKLLSIDYTHRLYETP